MKKVDEIIKKLKEVKPTLEQDFNIKEVGVFGSYVRGEQTENSDIDVLIDYNRGLTLFKLARLEKFLSDLFGVKVDLVLKNSLRPKIGQRILSEVIYV